MFCQTRSKLDNNKLTKLHPNQFQGLEKLYDLYANHFDYAECNFSFKL